MNGKAKAFACALLAVAVVGAVCASAVGSKRYYEYAYGEEATVETAAVKQGRRSQTNSAKTQTLGVLRRQRRRYIRLGYEKSGNIFSA